GGGKGVRASPLAQPEPRLGADVLRRSAGRPGTLGGGTARIRSGRGTGPSFGRHLWRGDPGPDHPPPTGHGGVSVGKARSGGELRPALPQLSVLPLPYQRRHGAEPPRDRRAEQTTPRSAGSRHGLRDLPRYGRKRSAREGVATTDGGASGADSPGFSDRRGVRASRRPRGVLPLAGCRRRVEENAAPVLAPRSFPGTRPGRSEIPDTVERDEPRMNPDALV